LTVDSPYAPSRRTDKVADWIEVTALRRGTSLGAQALQDLGNEVGFSAADVALGMTTMRRRARLLGSAYPFMAGAGIAARQEAPERVWTALLLMSADSPVRASLDITAAAEHLERITAESVRTLYGPGTSSVRFGWPSEDGRPADFSQAVQWLAQRMGVPTGGAYRPPHMKDGGVDVVAWRPFPDGRSGFPVLLAQCTLEKDFAHKAADIDLRLWSGWLAMDVDPATALAIPDVVPAGEEWNRLAARTVVLDRIRLASLLAGDESPRPRLAAVFSWLEESLRQVAELP
jgi:hypothetical protein